MSVSLFENKSESCPFVHQPWPGRAQVSWTPCLSEPTREAVGRSPALTSGNTSPLGSAGKVWSPHMGPVITNSSSLRFVSV